MSRQYKNGKCSCWKQLDKKLAEDSSALDVSWSFDGHTFLNVATYRTDGSKRKAARRVFASYCPFCGGKLSGK